MEILEGIERFMRSEGVPPSIRDLAERFSMAPPSMLGHIKALEKKGVIRRKRGKSRCIELTKHIGMARPLQVPILGRVSAGPPILAEENIEGTVLLDPALVKGKKLFALRIKGDSMIDAGFFENDLCIVQMTNVAENGDIVVALIDGEATVKKFMRKGRSIELIPANPDYQPIMVTEENSDFRILGKIVSLYRSL